jgi:site-specific DNA-cytosine methylase
VQPLPFQYNLSGQDEHLIGGKIKDASWRFWLAGYAIRASCDLSVEEFAAIQTFPPGLRLAGSPNQRYRQLGTAVPVKFAQAIAEHLKQYMVGHLRRGFEQRAA